MAVTCVHDFIQAMISNHQELPHWLSLCRSPFGQTETRIAYVRPCLLPDREEMSNLYRGTSIDASYHPSVHLTKQFQRRLKSEKLADDGSQVMA
jgi:ferredoxin-thioredoxin reductase catalytic subunit